MFWLQPHYLDWIDRRAQESADETNSYPTLSYLGTCKSILQKDKRYFLDSANLLRASSTVNIDHGRNVGLS
jgi:hypothetical protein